MKSDYNYDENTKTYTCPVCGYKRIEEMKYDGKILEGDEPFIEMENFALHSTSRDGYYPTPHTHTVYACPKCGILQLNI
jgi:predicted RNA-binding Zn-ribbon protein involved in translation (DUF1610 family)